MSGAVVAMATAMVRTLHVLSDAPLGGAVTSDGDFHRSWVQLLPEGEYETERHGTLDFGKAALRKYKASFDQRARGIDIALDVDHKAPRENDTRAAGWIERVELGEAINRPAGLWALVRWTPYGLSEVKSQQYRYISAEVTPGQWLNEITGRTFDHVISGMTLTNRPVMKNMQPIELSEKRKGGGKVSRRAWGGVDKSKLPDSCFLDPANRRLPIYEGAGEIGPDGRYTQRGALNLHGARAALAAIHGARRPGGKAMSGLPAGTVARLRRLLAKHDTGGNGDSAGGGRNDMADEQERDDVALGEGEHDDVADGAEAGGAFLFAASSKGKKGAEPDDDEDDLDDSEDPEADGEAAMADDAGDEEMADGDGDEDDQPEDDSAGKESPVSSSATGSAKKGAKKPKAKSLAEIGAADVTTLSEAERTALLSELLVERAALKRRAYERDVEHLLGGWEAGRAMLVEARVKNPAAAGAKAAEGRAVRVTLSKPAREAARALFLSEFVYALSEEQRTQVGRAIELAALGGVDLSVRGSSFDQEARETVTSTGAKKRAQAAGVGGESAALLSEATHRVATEAGEDYEALVRLQMQNSWAGREAAAKVRRFQDEAAERIGYGHGA